MLKPIIAAVATTLLSLPAIALPTLAQTVSTTLPPGTKVIVINDIAFNRAKNLARQTAEKINGGLSHYRAESSMYGPAYETPYKDNGDGTWTFSFLGHKPSSTISTTKSIITVSQNGQITVNYNGLIK